MGASKFSIYLHDELSLALQLISVEQLLLFKLAASSVGVLGLLDLIQACLNDRVFQEDALLELFGRLGQPFLCRPVVPFVVSTLFIKLKLQGAGHVSFECENVEV